MKALLLLSGGFDSPVAGHLMKDKTEIVALTFSQEPVLDNREVIKAKKLAEKLGIKKFISVKMGNQLAEIVQKCQHKFYYILQRRMMLRVAEQIAKEEGCEVILTGDNLGQVGSQTLSNMSVIDSATSLTILRPVICNDKKETIDIAREIETYDISCGPELCALLGPKHPATSSTPNLIDSEENKLDTEQMKKDVLSTKEDEILE